ncbi:MAG: RNA 3'-terminal phosphate cyclase [Acidobacteria bacterium]|nr:RNA 3'-terminal phosphate cyclase [Acidobacteriota bacterium]
MIMIDGSAGEGGGQILRTALALAVVTGKPFRMHSIRAGRRTPGLGNQHLAAVRAAATISQAGLEGAGLGAGELTFRPGPVMPGQYHFSTGTAGSAMLVLQAVLPPLLLAAEPSRLELEGGTHNPWAPPFDFLRDAYAPLLSRAGVHLHLTLKRHGFFPAGGGQALADIQPGPVMKPLTVLWRGTIRRIGVTGLVGRLPRRIAVEETTVAARELAGYGVDTDIREVDSVGPGNAIMVKIECEEITEVFTAFGQRGVPARQVGAQVAGEVRQYLDSGVPVGPYLADQLLLPLALAGRGEFLTGEPSTHTRSNIAVITRFLHVIFDVRSDGPGRYRIACRPQ